MLASCGADATESATSNQSDVAAKGESTTSTIKIANIEVMTEDLGKMKWDEAKIACAKLGDGWRLPTKDELNILYENKDKIGGFAEYAYWSSTEGENSMYHSDRRNGKMWQQRLGNGIKSTSTKNKRNRVRAIRSL